MCWKKGCLRGAELGTLLPSNPLSLHEAFPPAILGADEGHCPAGQQPDGQEEDAASLVGDALDDGGERHVSPLMTWFKSAPRLGERSVPIPGALFGNRLSIWTMLR
jgi:hypothetical protein